MELGATDAATRPTGFVARVIEIWALLGGIVLLGIVLMVAWSVLRGWLFDRPLQGDVEMTEMWVAVAAFMFLPYCQLTGANVTADIFTARAGPRAVALFELISALVALAFSVLLLWRMYYGFLDYRTYVETTTILHVPIWYAYVPALMSLALLALASLISVRNTLRAWKSAR
ncbi:MAG TPA: TRAP transporter small permease [Burkholderiales bacterium]|nr:TRAP transporter small permease [Burkholderiales bacterium]